MKNKKFIKLLLYVFLFLVLVLLGMYLSNLSDVKSIDITGTGYTSETEVLVEIKGEVKSPGKYSVPVGTPLHDAIYMADGLTKHADPKSVNMSALITNSCTITVSKTQRQVQSTVSTHSFSSEDRCDINTASVSELTSLPGIGESLALDIINYRKVNDKFKTIEELKNIKGIGDKKYDMLRDLIKVGG